MKQIVCPVGLFRDLLLIVHRGKQAVVRVGMQRTSAGQRWLFRSPAAVEGELAGAQGSPDDEWPTGAQPRFLVVGAGGSGFMPLIAPPLVGVLVLGRGEHSGKAWAAVAGEQGLEPLDSLALPGPGMHEVPLSGRPEPAHKEELDVSAWSRTIGALGGEDVWRSLRRQRIALIGCGRSGSLTAEALARVGIAHLLLIDGDRLERTNLGEMAVLVPDDVGQYKVAALARRLNEQCPHTQVHTLAVPITYSSALALASTADALFCCVDSDAARLSAGILAAAYHKVLVDVGTRIPPENEPGAPVAEADVRIILPDQPGCLLCCGGLSDHQRAVEDICLPELACTPQDQFGTRRLGSLRSLNMLACSVALHMFQEVVTGRLPTSRWARLLVDPTGEIVITHPQISALRGCSLCARAGIGDAAGLGLNST